MDWQRNGEFLRETGYHAAQIGDEVVKPIEKHDIDDGRLPMEKPVLPKSPVTRKM